MTEVQKGRNLPLDGLRGVAILGVLFYHMIGVGAEGGVLPQTKIEKFLNLFFAEGWAGVDLFFVLSGFLITSILLKSKDQPHYFSYFYMRRLLRIFPLYYLFLIIYFLILPRLYPEVPRFQYLGDRQWWYWTYTSNFEVLLKGRWIPPAQCWSLAIEEQFYWVWPLLVFFLSRSKLLIVSLVLFLIQPILRWQMVQHGFAPVVVPTFTLAHLDGLMLGGAIAIIYQQMRASFQSYKKVGWALFVFGLVGRGFLPMLSNDYEFNRAILGVFYWTCVGTGMLVLSLAHRQEALINQVLSFRGFTYFGKYSYAIYMINHQIFEFVAWILPPTQELLLYRWIQIFVLGMAITLSLSMLSFKYFEGPFLRLKELFSNHEKSMVSS